MTYNPSVPQPTDIPAQSQADFLTNFTQLNTIFDVDHVPFNDASAANRGKHDKSTYIEQGADPVTATNEISLYTKDVAASTRLFMRQENAGSVLPLSGADPYNSVTANKVEVSTFLPGFAGTTTPMILKSGRLRQAGLSSGTWALGTINFVSAFPTACVSVVITPERGNNSIHVMYINNSSIGASSFQIRSDDTSWDFLNYTALGY